MSNNRGSRNRRLHILKPGTARNAANQLIGGYEPFLERWGESRTSTGMAVVRQLESGVPHVPGRYSWRINYTPQVTRDMRVRYKEFYYTILDARHDHANREFTDLVCEEVIDNG